MLLFLCFFFLGKAPTSCGNLYLARRSLLLTIIAFEEERVPSPFSPKWNNASLVLTSLGMDDHNHEASRALCSYLCPVGCMGWLLLPCPSFITALLLGLYPLSLSSIPWEFIDATDAIVDPIPSPGKREMLRHHPFLEMLTDYEGSHPQKSQS